MRRFLGGQAYHVARLTEEVGVCPIDKTTAPNALFLALSIRVFRLRSRSIFSFDIFPNCNGNNFFEDGFDSICEFTFYRRILISQINSNRIELFGFIFDLNG